MRWDTEKEAESSHDEEEKKTDKGQFFFEQLGCGLQKDFVFLNS